MNKNNKLGIVVAGVVIFLIIIGVSIVSAVREQNEYEKNSKLLTESMRVTSTEGIVREWKTTETVYRVDERVNLKIVEGGSSDGHAYVNPFYFKMDTDQATMFAKELKDLIRKYEK